MPRAYYHNTIDCFLSETPDSILGKLAQNNEYPLIDQARNAWMMQIRLLKQWLSDTPGNIILEYTIPRLGKRIDTVLLVQGIIFVLEFKVGASDYQSEALDQVTDYALDLKYFHEGSQARTIIPVLIATSAQDTEYAFDLHEDNVAKPVRTNGSNLDEIVRQCAAQYTARPMDADAWLSGAYMPTPTIIEAAQRLYQDHSVAEIARSDAGAINLTRTTQAVTDIILQSKKRSQKSICFVTGVPGAGKMLAGLNIANTWHSAEHPDHPVFLSGNGPLVQILREALIRNRISSEKDAGARPMRSTIRRSVDAFIQNVHHFRDEALNGSAPPINKIAIFDEAQRAWNLEQTSGFMRRKKNVADFNQSEPEFLIGYMDRHQDWATIICLVGGGQEINTGEAGLQEWFDALARSFHYWNVYISDHLADTEYLQAPAPLFAPEDTAVTKVSDLHLAVSLRSFRSERVSAFVKALLDLDSKAPSIYHGASKSYEIALTRNIDRARNWLREKARGTERYGLLATSGAARLRPHGINIKADIEPVNWFLNVKEDVRSSYYLEDVATEFDVQGLELDWTCVAWDADFRIADDGWSFNAFRGTHWQSIRSNDAKRYLKNAYRVLLTRARQGMVIYVPEGNDRDYTRPSSYYDGTYDYLKALGLRMID